MPSLKDVIKPKLLPKLKVRGIPNFLSKLDTNTSHQAQVWNAKTYQVDPGSHVFTTIQEHFGNRLIKSLPLPKDAVVVDIGCFIGEKLWQLSAHRHYLGIGVDIALPALQAAQKIDIYGHKFIAADMENLPFKDSSVDLVFVFDVIEHLTHANRGFAELSRVLKPGGRVLLHIPIKDNTGSLFWFKQILLPSSAAKDYADVGHSPNRMLTRDQIRYHFASTGMTLDQEIPYNAFLVHFWDREFVRIIAWILAMLFRSGQTKTRSARSVHTGKLGIIRSVYGRTIVPILEIISWPDKLLTWLGIANTSFFMATKK